MIQDKTQRSQIVACKQLRWCLHEGLCAAATLQLCHGCGGRSLGDSWPQVWEEVSEERCWSWRAELVTGLNYMHTPTQRCHCHLSSSSPATHSPFPWQVSWLPALWKFWYVACWVVKLRLCSHSSNVDVDTAFSVKLVKLKLLTLKICLYFLFSGAESLKCKLLHTPAFN